MTERTHIGTRQCRYCFEELVQRPDEPLYAFRHRQHCNLSCAGHAHAIAGRHQLKEQRKAERAKLVRKSKPVPVSGPRCATIEEWLATHEVTMCPPRYVAPIYYAGSEFSASITGDGRVR